MSNLLEEAVAAHGGLDRWNGVTSIDVAASITGATWFVKGKGDALKNVRFEVDTTRERLTMDFVGQDKRSIFEPSRVVMQHGDGTLIDSRDDPERSFEGHTLATPWDDIHVAYFSGEALWTYLNTPFVFTWPGFVTEEITPIQVGGEKWRRLKVTFPDYIKSHTREQISCFCPGRTAAPPRLHRRYPGRRNRIELCHRLSQGGWDYHPHQAADLWLGG